MYGNNCYAIQIFHARLKVKILKYIANLRAWLNGNAMFYETFICFYVSEAKPFCFGLCSQMFDDVERS